MDIIHHIYWRWHIWWNGWEFDVPDYWDDFDVDEYIDNLLELEMGYVGDDEEDLDQDVSPIDYVIVIDPNGHISLGKPFEISIKHIV